MLTLKCAVMEQNACRTGTQARIWGLYRIGTQIGKACLRRILTIYCPCRGTNRTKIGMRIVLLIRMLKETPARASATSVALLLDGSLGQCEMANTSVPVVRTIYLLYIYGLYLPRYNLGPGFEQLETRDRFKSFPDNDVSTTRAGRHLLYVSKLGIRILSRN